MQPSITSFFKVKPAKQPVDEDIQSGYGEEPPQEQQATEKTSYREGAQGSGSGSAAPSCKRALESDDDDDDENQVKTARNKKRPTLSSAENSPVKNTEQAKGTPTKSAPEEQMKVGLAAVRSPVVAPRQVFAQSPLLNVQALINAKISSGSHALHENIGVTWFKALQLEFDKPYFKNLSKFVSDQRAQKTVYPPADKVYTWTHHHPIRDTRVVIIGQDPYHGPNQAHGLSFSVQKGIAVPKSLQNIYAELRNDISGFKQPAHGSPNSHQGKGWEKLTDAVILWISKNVSHKVVFILWGRYAQQKSSLIDKRHKILTAAHPSPLSAHNGFMGCKHFSQTNAFLKAQKLPEIDWTAL